MDTDGFLASDPAARALSPVRAHDPSIGDEWRPASTEAGMYLGVTVPPRRLALFGAAGALLVAVFLARAFAVQVIGGGEYRALAEGNRLRDIRVIPARGILLDRRGTPLVRNVPSFAISVIGADLPRDADTLTRVSSTLERYGISSEEWEDALADARATPYQTVTLANRLSYEQGVAFEVESARLPGVSLHVATERAYLPDRAPLASMAHVLGYEGKISADEYARRKDEGYGANDRVGKTGLEAALEEELRGRMGDRQIEIDAVGRERRTVSSHDPVIGRNVRLTLDLPAQEALERALAAALRRSGARRGAAVAIDPRDGGVIALVSLPGFDQNVFARGVGREEYRALAEDPDAPLFPRAVAGQYPSGSTIKPVVAIAGLAEGIITPKTTVRSTGGLWYKKRWFFPDWKSGGHGATDVVKAIAESVNTFFYMIGGGTEGFVGLGPERLASYLRSFGFGERSGIELPGEGSGLVPTPEWKRSAKGEEWYIGDTYHMAIGQGDVLATPLQVAAMTAALANGGTLWRPHLVAATYDPETREWSENPAERIADDTALADEIATVKRGMRATVTVGSARSLADAIVPVAGKTGTAEWSDRRSPHAWFTGYAPADAPTLAVTVLVEEGGEGSAAAAPAAEEFIDWYFAAGTAGAGADGT